MSEIMKTQSARSSVQNLILLAGFLFLNVSLIAALPLNYSLFTINLLTAQFGYQKLPTTFYTNA